MSRGIVDQAMDYLADHLSQRKIVNSSTQTINANGATWFKATAPANAVGIVGYYLIGTNSVFCNVYACRIDPSTGELALAVRNLGSNQASIYVQFSVLCS